MRSMIKACIVGLSLCATGCFNAEKAESTDDRAQQILNNLTLEQKIAQMIQPEIRHVTPDDARKYGFGGILNGGGSFPNSNKQSNIQDWIDLADEYYLAAKEANNGGIPIIWGTDAVHGHNNVIGATYFPHNIGLGAARNPDLIENIARITAQEVKATGIDWIFAPTVAVAKDYRWGRTYESYADDPALIYNYAERAVIGIQSEGIVATAKHFIGDGATIRGKDQGDVKIPLEELLKEHGTGYDGALKANVHTVMASFNSWYGDKVHGSKKLMTDVLKEQMNFDGFIVSDWNGIGQVKGCNNADCAQAINAGIDMVMVPEDWKEMMETMKAQVQSNVIPLSRIDDAVLRILRVKLAMGMFEQDKPSTRITAALIDSVGSEAHRDVARQAVRQSLVMLKNNQQVLPLDDQQNVLIAGSAADNIGQQNGGWTLTWQGTNNSNEDFPNATSIYQGLKTQLEAGGSEVVLSVDGSYTTKPDVAVVVFGEQPYAEGQGDLQTLDFEPVGQDDIALMKTLKQQGIKVVGIFITGRPMWVNDAINASDAFVVAWLPGSEGQGVADVLVNNEGKYDFVGTLPFPWPAVDVNVKNENLPVDTYLFEKGYGLTYGQMVEMEDNLDEEPKKQMSSSDSVIYRRGTQAPYQAYVGDESNWLKAVSGASTESSFGELSMTSFDVAVQEDARRIEFSGDGTRPSQFFWKTPSDQGVDLSSLAEAGGALAFRMRVETPPQGNVELRMDCVWPCSGSLNITETLKTLETDTWLDVSIPLRCFEQAGTDTSKVNAPAVFITDQAFVFSVLEVTVTATPEPTSLIQCP